MDTHLEYFNWVLFQRVMEDWSIEDYFNKGRILCEYIMSIFQGVIEYNSMEYYFNGERILCEYIGDYFILLIIQYMWL